MGRCFSIVKFTCELLPPPTPPTQQFMLHAKKNTSKNIFDRLQLQMYAQFLWDGIKYDWIWIELHFACFHTYIPTYLPTYVLYVLVKVGNNKSSSFSKKCHRHHHQSAVKWWSENESISLPKREHHFKLYRRVKTFCARLTIVWRCQCCWLLAIVEKKAILISFEIRYSHIQSPDLIASFFAM